MEVLLVPLVLVLMLASHAFAANRVFWDAQRRGLNARKWRLIVLLVPSAWLWYLMVRPRNRNLY